jgi:hypothetical protein
MTEDRLPLAELLQKAGDGDFLRSVAEAVLQLLMEADAEGLIGAGRHERSPERLNYRRYHDVPRGQVAALGGKHGAGAGCRRGRGGPDGHRAEQGELVAGGA